MPCHALPCLALPCLALGTSLRLEDSPVQSAVLANSAPGQRWKPARPRQATPRSRRRRVNEGENFKVVRSGPNLLVIGTYMSNVMGRSFAVLRRH